MIKSLYVAQQRRGEQQKVPEIRVVAGRGIVGDRSFDKSKWPGQTVAEHATRRNVVTEGVRLNDLVGREFSVGGVRFRGVEPCEPCAFLGELLANESIAGKDVVKAWIGRGGLRADALSDGTLKIGMPVEID